MPNTLQKKRTYRKYKKNDLQRDAKSHPESLKIGTAGAQGPDLYNLGKFWGGARFLCSGARQKVCKKYANMLKFDAKNRRVYCCVGTAECAVPPGR